MIFITECLKIRWTQPALLCLLPLVFSCQRPTKTNPYEQLPKQQTTAIPYPVQIHPKDTLYIDASATSLKGNWRICGNQLYYADENIVRVTSYDSIGNELENYFTYGRGPGEFRSPPLAFFRLQNSNYCYADKNASFFLLDSTLYPQKEVNLLSLFIPRKNVKRFYNQLLRHPDPDNPAMYEINFQSCDFIEFNGNILFPVTTEHAKYNGYFRNNRAPEFYQNSHTLLALHRDSLTFVRLFASFPPGYYQRMIPNFKDCHIATCDSLLFVSYEADPNIYIYNQNFQLSGYFGEKEKKIREDLPQTHDLEEAELNYFRHRQKYGYYGNMLYTAGYLFRSLKVPGNKPGLQIYKEFALVHSAEMPYETFDVIGYIFPYYYAVIQCDLGNEQYQIARFTLTD